MLTPRRALVRVLIRPGDCRMNLDLAALRIDMFPGQPGPEPVRLLSGHYPPGRGVTHARFQVDVETMTGLASGIVSLASR